MGTRSRITHQLTMLKRLLLLQMLRYIVILSFCVTSSLGAVRVLPGWSDSPTPTYAPPATTTTTTPPPEYELPSGFETFLPPCDSCCDPPPRSLRSDQTSCDVLERRILMVEEAMEYADCYNGFVGREEVSAGERSSCDTLTAEAIPACMQPGVQDSDECLDKVANRDMNWCKCMYLENMKEDLIRVYDFACWWQ